MRVGAFIIFLCGIPLAAQNAYFARTTSVPIPSVAMRAPASIATGDFNRDGQPDLAVAAENAVLVFDGGPGGRFPSWRRYSLPSLVRWVVAVDMNQDDILDLVTANGPAGSISILAGNGDGTFRDRGALLVAAGKDIAALAVADFNGDGYPDVAAALNPTGALILDGDADFRLRPRTTLSYPQDGLQSQHILAGDFNADGTIDLAVGHGNIYYISLFAGNGDGTFRAPQTLDACQLAGTIVAGDFNGDGATDLVVLSAARDGVWLLAADGAGGFRPSRQLPMKWSERLLAAGDWNRDGNLDLVGGSDLTRHLSIAFGTGDGSFSAVRELSPGTFPIAAAIADFDQDAWPDLAVVNVNGENVTVLLNRGEGALAPATTIGPFRATAFEAMDLRGEGPLTLVVANPTGREIVRIDVPLNNTAAEPAAQSIAGDCFALSSADFTGDGVPDLAAACRNPNEIVLLRGRRDGALESIQRIPLGSWAPHAVTAGRWNSDGPADLFAISSSTGAGLFVAPGRDDNGFDLPVQFSPGDAAAQSFAVADFTGDGVADIVLADYGRGLLLLRGAADGSFEAPVLWDSTKNIVAIAAADFNGDGKPDLVAADNRNSAVLTFINDGAAFHPGPAVRVLSPLSLVVADFNSDGKMDWAAASPSPNSLLVALGKGDGSFSTPRAFPAPASFSLLRAADLNRDGRPDLAAVNDNGIVIFWNDAVEPPPPALTAPRPDSPPAGAEIAQNAQIPGCPMDPINGSGFLINFVWTASGPPEFVRGYELQAGRRGFPPVLNLPTPALSFLHRQCGFVGDQELSNWEWRVRAVGEGENRGPWSDAVSFRFSPCRFLDGRPCGVPPAPGGPVGTSVPAGNMSVPRTHHSATPIAGGKVLIVGGDNATTGRPVELASAEIYDPATARFTPTGPLRAGRSFHRATLLADGRVLITGGYALPPPPAAPTALASAEIYNPATGQFTPTGDMRESRVQHAAVRLPDGRVLITGGVRPPLNVPATQTAEIYNPATGAFTYTASMNYPRYSHAAVLLTSGQVFLFGDGASDVPGELYDPAQNRFTPTASLTPHRNAGVAALPNAQALIAGGWAFNGPTGAAELFDFNTRAFTPLARGVVPRMQIEATPLADSSVLLSGGAGPGGNPHGEVERYLPVLREIRALPPLMMPRSQHTATLLPDGRVLITGGYAPTGIQATTELYTITP